MQGSGQVHLADESLKPKRCVVPGFVVARNSPTRTCGYLERAAIVLALVEGVVGRGAVVAVPVGVTTGDSAVRHVFVRVVVLVLVLVVRD